MERQPNTEYILSISYGKDSIACLEAIKQLGYPLDRIIHAEVWATDDIPADLPPMVEFKKKADAIIEERYGYTVEHVRAHTDYLTYFYRKRSDRVKTAPGEIQGWPFQRGAWCQSRLKRQALRKIERKGVVQYLGIAADEPERIARHTKPGKILPLVDIGWDEAYCRKWCEENDLLSPIYSTATRGGCWFCHNQGVDLLRLLRKDYPDLWALLLKWDADSPVTFKANGHTVHDFDKRFFAEDLNLVPKDRTFRWKNLDVALSKYLDEVLRGD